MPADKMTIVRNAYASFLSGNIPGFLATFDDDSVLIEAASLPYGGEYRGRAAIGGLLADMAAAWDGIGFAIQEIVEGDRLVIAYGQFTAIGRATGKAIAFPIAEVWEFDGDKVKSLTPVYFDTVAALAALS